MEKINFNVPGGHKKLLKYTICLLPAQIQKNISSPAKPDTLVISYKHSLEDSYSEADWVKPTALIFKTEQRYGRERHVRDRRGPRAPSSFSGSSVEPISLQSRRLSQDFFVPSWVRWLSEQRKTAPRYTLRSILMCGWLQEPNDFLKPFCVIWKKKKNKPSPSTSLLHSSASEI